MKQRRYFSCLCLAAAALSAVCGCSTLNDPEAQAALIGGAQTVLGTAGLSERLTALEERAVALDERQQLSYAFTWLTAEKAGITETQARDWLAGRAELAAETPEPVPADVDAVDFARLDWKFGGVDGSKAALSSPRLSGLRAGASSLSYHWDVGLSDWGLANSEAGALACFFVEKEDGSVVGGKFDWVSTSRSSRNLANVFEGYGGWSLAGVPNPTRCYLVVVSKDGRKRSNVIGAEWSR